MESFDCFCACDQPSIINSEMRKELNQFYRLIKNVWLSHDCIHMAKTNKLEENKNEFVIR